MPDQNLSVLFNSLQNARKTKEVGKYKIFELTLNQQRELLSTVFDQFESPVRASLAFNKIIKDCSEVINGSYKDLTVIDKNIILREIRDLSFGTKFTKTIINSETDEPETVNFEFTKINTSKLNKIKLAKTFNVNEAIKFNLTVPTLDRDNEVNKILLQNIISYKKGCENRHEPIDRGFITSQYLSYELIKYVDSIDINDTSYKMTNLIISEQLRIINEFPQFKITDITDFAESIKESEALCFSALNLKDNKTEVIALDYTILSKDL